MIKIDEKTRNSTHISDLQITVMIRPGNYHRIVNVGFMMTSFLVANL